MRKKVFGRKFKRTKDQRRALFKGLLSSLVLLGSIKTTEQKAKARSGGTNLKNDLQEYLTPEAVDTMISSIAPRFANRPGGYTRILRLGKRFNDNASVVMLEWVVGQEISHGVTKKVEKVKVVTGEKEVSKRRGRKPKAK